MAAILGTAEGPRRLQPGQSGRQLEQRSGRCANRSNNDLGNRNNNLGFRLLITVDRQHPMQSRLRGPSPAPSRRLGPHGFGRRSKVAASELVARAKVPGWRIFSVRRGHPGCRSARDSRLRLRFFGGRRCALPPCGFPAGEYGGDAGSVEGVSLVTRGDYAGMGSM